MHRILGKFVITIPVATALYMLLVFFAGLNFDVKWLILAIAFDVADWVVAEAT